MFFEPGTNFDLTTDCNCYLAYIFLQEGASDNSVRSAAGLLLKNNVRFEYGQIPPESLQYLKEASFHGLRDTETLIRSIAGNIITSIIYRGGVMSWPEALPRLMQMLDDPNDQVNEVSLQIGPGRSRLT